jgi:pimeloyl-ACP methyl ester carboxylesterase
VKSTDMAEPIVFIPGLACTQALFRPQMEDIARGRTPILLDHTLDETIARIAARFLADAPERFALIGLSMGGYIALEIMRQARERVTRLALLDTSARPDTEEATERRRRLIAIAEGGRLIDIHPLLWERLVAPARRGDATLEAIVWAMMRDSGAETFIRQQRAIIGRADSRPFLALIRVPTLVLVGSEDAITPSELAEEMAGGIAGARLVVVPGSGHLSTLEAPQAVNAALSRWLLA